MTPYDTYSPIGPEGLFKGDPMSASFSSLAFNPLDMGRVLLEPGDVAWRSWLQPKFT